MKATEQYFPVVVFIMLFKMVLTFQSVDEMLNQHEDSATRKRCKRIASYFEGIIAHFLRILQKLFGVRRTSQQIYCIHSAVYSKSKP